MRRPLMAGNWKMYKTPAQTTAFFEKFLPLVAESKHCDILICPPMVSIAAALAAASSGRVAIGAQNVFWENEGAYTGEVSAAMLAGAGCGWVIIGHSERRQYFGETNEGVLKRTRAALGAGLRPIVCVGERLEDREGDRTEAVLEEQFRDGIGPLAPEQFAAVVIAYEPVWAIARGARRRRSWPVQRIVFCAGRRARATAATRRSCCAFSMAAASSRITRAA